MTSDFTLDSACNTCSETTLNIQEHADLQALNTLLVPARARWLCRAYSEQHLLGCLEFVRSKNCPLFVLGGGSNVLLPEYFPGLVIVMQIRGRRLIQETEEDWLVEFSAGENWHETVLWSVENGLSGIENLALIPGSVGAAPIQNIGAYGVELESCFEYLGMLEIASGQIITLNRTDCEFSYRDSIFKHRLKDTVIITRVALRLSKLSRFILDYPALGDALAHCPAAELSPARIAQAVIQIRQDKLPNPKVIPNAGSFFKNPTVDCRQYAELKKYYPDMVAYEVDDRHFKLAAGWLLEKAGWKGREEEGISMHRKQALVLTNPHTKTAEQILVFADRVRASIRQRFGVTLEIEPRILSFP